MNSAFLRKSIALSLSALLLFLPAASLGAFCSCLESDSACCQADSAEKPLSACCTEAGDAAVAASCCGEFAAPSEVIPDARATKTINDSKPHTVSPALEGLNDAWRPPPSGFSVLAAEESKNRGSRLPAYLLFCSLLI